MNNFDFHKNLLFLKQIAITWSRFYILRYASLGIWMNNKFIISFDGKAVQFCSLGWNYNNIIMNNYNFESN